MLYTFQCGVRYSIIVHAPSQERPHFRARRRMSGKAESLRGRRVPKRGEATLRTVRRRGFLFAEGLKLLT